MSKAREWVVMYRGRYDTAISHTAPMCYRKAQQEAKRIKSEYGGWSRIVERPQLLPAIREFYWADAIHGGQPPIA